MKGKHNPEKSKLKYWLEDPKELKEVPVSSLKNNWKVIQQKDELQNNDFHSVYGNRNDQRTQAE